MEKLLDEIESYWSTRTEGYSEVNHKELAGTQKNAWLKVLTSQFPDKPKEEIRILDIGTGPGFFPVILAEAGYHVDAVDYTEGMLEKAKENAGDLCRNIRFLRMDAQKLDFEDNTFDVVISRNLTWNLEHPDVAYREWVRVLKVGGRLLNFDANWYGYLYEEEQRKAYENDRKNVENNSLDDHYLCTDIERMERIALQVPLSKISRPQWDVKTLREAGLLGIRTDTEIWKTVWSEEERLNYQSTPMFMVTGVKPDHFLNLPVAAGEKTEGFLELGDGEFVLPATIIRGKDPGKTVLVTAGLHAGEYVGIQTLIELSKRLKPEKVKGQLVLVKVLNREDFEKRAGSISWEDGKNLNRVFPGKKDGTKMERLAAAITESLIRKADYYIDLHGGDDYEELTPYVYFAGVAKPEIVEASRKMAEQVDVPYMVQSNVSTGGAYNYAASTFHIPAVLLERGCMGTWEREEVDSMRRDVRNILCSIGAYNGIRSHSTYYPLKMDDVRYQCASVNGLWYPVKKPGDIVHQDEYLGEIRDYEGNVQEICRADMDGVILYQVSSLQVVEGGPVITYGNIVREKDERKTRIAQYWTKRSDSFLEQRRAELHSALAGRWMAELKKYLPEKNNLRILDVGCGTGFFTILLAKEGHQVTGIDLTPDMITHAKELAEEEKADCRFMVMDAEAPDFPDEEFDVIVSRNLTWTLPDAEHAYQEWFRVLKPGGVMINLDANYGAADFADTADLPENHAHHQIQDELMQECEDIKRQLPISSFLRPAWDLETLGRIGVEEFSFDLGISKRIYTEKDEFYNPTPMFLIFAKKQR